MMFKFIPKIIRHIKNNTYYAVVGKAEVKLSTRQRKMIKEGDFLVVLRDQEGKLYIRIEDEVNEDRYQVIHPPQKNSTKSESSTELLTSSKT